MKEKPLEGLKVLEFADFISGPYCGRLLADFGAEVVKIERPEKGEEARQHGPFPQDSPHPEKSGLFLFLNGNKKGITLDIEAPRGRELFEELIRKVDILVENNPRKKMEDWGLNYESLGEINPELIMTSITPYGWTGPYKDYKGYAINTAAFGGMSMTVGDPEREPLNPPYSLSHYQSGAMATVATMAAVFGREITGRGQHVDVSEAETWATAHTGQIVSAYVFHGLKKMRGGFRLPGSTYPTGIFRCKDGFVYMLAIQGFQWKRFLEVVGDGKIPDWYANDPRFKDRREMQLKYADEIDALLAPWLMEHTKEEIFQICREKHIPFAPVKTIAEIVNEPHFRERGCFVQLEHPVAGKTTYPQVPFRFSESFCEMEKTAPLLGQNNEEIYCQWLGYSGTEVALWRNEGII